MNKNKQKGFIGKGLEDAMAGLLIFAVIISAVVGWGVIEGLLWILSHISIGWV